MNPSRKPRQSALFPARSKQPKTSQAVTYDTRNRECAALILAHVARYGGDEAGLVKWARTVSGKANGC